MEGDETQLVRQLAAIPDANVNWQINKHRNECVVVMNKDPRFIK
jgi:hypothetical protein